VLQCVAVCCSVLQRAVACLDCPPKVATDIIVLQCVAVCCSVLQCVSMHCSALQCVAVCCSVLPCVAVCCHVLQCTLEIATYNRMKIFLEAIGCRSRLQEKKVQQMSTLHPSSSYKSKNRTI